MQITGNQRECTPKSNIGGIVNFLLVFSFKHANKNFKKGECDIKVFNYKLGVVCVGVEWLAFQGRTVMKKKKFAKKDKFLARPSVSYTKWNRK